MLAGITPLGERSRGNRWLTTVAFYNAGAWAGGLAIGALAGGLGQLLGLGAVDARLRAALLVALAVAGGLLDLRVHGLRLPSFVRQVDAGWMTELRGWVYGAGFGAQLGFAVATIVIASATYVWLAVAVLSGSVQVGAAVGLSFGVVRGLTLLRAGGVRRPRDLVALTQALSRWNGPMTRATAAVQVGSAVALLVYLQAR